MGVYNSSSSRVLFYLPAMDPRVKSVTLTCQYTIETNSATILSRTLAPRRTGNTLPTRYDEKGKNSRSLVVHKDRQRGNLLYTRNIDWYVLLLWSHSRASRQAQG